MKITSLKNIANHMNKYFDNKIREIRNKFTEPTVDPIELLGKLINKPETKFTLP